MSYRSKAYDLIDHWINDPNSSKEIISFLVDQLAADTYWLRSNISTNDKKILFSIVEELK